MTTSEEAPADDNADRVAHLEAEIRRALEMIEQNHTEWAQPHYVLTQALRDGT